MATFRVQKNRDNPYTVMSNFHLRDRRLSWKAKGLLSYLLHLPDDWKINIEDLKKRSRSKRISTETAVEELIYFGYIEKVTRKQYKDSEGKFCAHDYDVFEKPVKL
jgi:hypothetical protein